ncbi:MAG: amidohydrolase family protein [Gemmatimonadales bacterium]
MRVNGITSVVTSASGGQIQGYAALIDLAGWTPDEMAIQPMAAMVMSYPRTFGGRFRRARQDEGDPAERLNRQVRELRDYLRNARAYSKIAKPAKTDLAFEAMRPIFGGQVPTVFDVETPEQIRGVFALADEFELRVILRGASQAWELADSIAARKIPVIVGPTTRPPEGDDPYDAIYANPGVLVRAGITIAFQTDDAADSRNLPYNAALATAYGLDPDEALRALTINPARIFGVADRLGSLEVGKVANLQLTTGDPLDVRTVVRQVFVRGAPTEMQDRHTRLYEKFRARPEPR